MMSEKVMKLIDEYSGIMQCKVCGDVKGRMVQSGGRAVKGSWQCQHGCELSEKVRNNLTNAMAR